MNESVPEAASHPTGDEELRFWLAGYIRDHPHHTTSVLSRSQFIGVARRALDSYLAGTYFLPKEQGGGGVNPAMSKIEHAIQAYRDRVEGIVRQGYQNTFVATKTWFRLQQACATAIAERSIVVVYGRPGVGKSRCLMEFAIQQMTTAPILVLCSRNTTVRFFLQRLAREVNLDDRMGVAELENAIAEKLKRHTRPIFVDQANYLDERALGALCFIWEVAHVPVVLVGTRDLYDQFTSSRLTEDVRAQLSSRVATHYLLSELTIAEAKAIIARALGGDATDDAVKQIYAVTGGVHRHVDFVLPRILQLKSLNKKKLESGDVTMGDIIRIAGSRLMT